MKNLRLLILVLCFATSAAFSQDSTRFIRHEIGFNTVSLIKQLISNNPGNTLDQLPYDLFYNYYFSEKTGMRVGLGVLNLNTSTEIEGQKDPRTNNQLGLNVRLGLTNNFIRQNRLTLNAFADVLYENVSLKTANTSTSQSFPNPVTTTKITSNDVTTGIGAQLGVGVKYCIYKHLCVYAEVPLSFLAESTTSKLSIEESGFPTENSTNKTKASALRVSLPTTIYLVLRF